MNLLGTDWGSSAASSVDERGLLLGSQRTDIPALRRLLGCRGMALVQAEPGDVRGRTLRRIVAELGTAEAHDSGGRDVWDIRYDPAAADRGGTRSLTLKPFPFHTDGSFEEPAPRCIALYVVREDRFGGGVTLLVEAGTVLRLVSDRTRSVLRTTRFRFRVPAEFTKGESHRDLPILLGDGLLRYRREIIDEAGCTPEQAAALDELDAAIGAVEPTRLTLPSGMILLLDNARFLHARTAVHDPDRHLLRMRFNLAGEISS